jgi:hypothetical protein
MLLQVIHSAPWACCACEAPTACFGFDRAAPRGFLCAGELWSREKLMAHASGVVVAGMDTTAHAVAWGL